VGRIRSAVAVLATCATALGSQLPGVSFFTNFAPPDFGALKLVTGGLTLAVFVWVFRSWAPGAAAGKTSIIAVLTAVFLAIGYSALLDWTTVSAPPQTGNAQRFQIGFGLAPFSLTPKGLELVQSSPDSVNPQYLMLATGGFQPGGAELVWKRWTITAAWLILSLVFLLSYLAWSFGLACVAINLTDRSKKIDQRGRRT
jgi:hypothetical protein